MRGRMNVLQKLGFLLIVISCVLMLGSEVLAIYNCSAAENLAEQIKSRFPERMEGSPDNYSDAAMPALQLDGEDFIGLVEVPSFGVCLPVGSNWDRVSLLRYPCRFWGSVYDNSLILGGSSKKGQFDFCGKLDLGDTIKITDMTATQFSYKVIRVDHRKHADMNTLLEANTHLTLFVQDPVSRDYIIVRCELA